MKRLFIILALTSVVSSLFAQYKINVSEKGENLGGGNHNAFSVMIYEADAKDVEKEWKKEMKDMGAKVTMKKEMFGDDATLKGMGDNSFDIYATVKESDKGVELIVAIDLGGAYLSSGQHSAEAKIIKDLLYNFAIKVTKEALDGILKEQEKVQKDFEKQLEDLVKAKEKSEKDIQDFEKSIEQAKKDIEQNKKDQEAKNKEIEAQKKVVADFAAKEKSVK